MGDLGQIVPLPVDFFDRESIARAVARSNVVINLIGIRQETKNWSFHDTHVKATHRLAQVCKEAGVPRFIQVSALGAHPDHQSQILKTKFEGEEVAKSFYPDVTIIRPALTFGFGDHFISCWIDLFHRPWTRRAPIVNGGESLVQPIFVEDVARAILHSITTEGHEGKTYHLAGPEIRKWKEMLALIQETHMYRRTNHLQVQSHSLKTALFIAKIYETLAIPAGISGLYTRESLLQMMFDMVLPRDQGILTLEDLHIRDATPIFPFVYQMCREQFRDASPRKLESLDGRDAYFE